MRIVLLVLAVLAFLMGMVMWAAAYGSIQESEALIVFLIAAVLLSGAAIVESVNQYQHSLTETLLGVAEQVSLWRRKEIKQ